MTVENLFLELWNSWLLSRISVAINAAFKTKIQRTGTKQSNHRYCCMVQMFGQSWQGLLVADLKFSALNQFVKYKNAYSFLNYRQSQILTILCFSL